MTQQAPIINSPNEITLLINQIPAISLRETEPYSLSDRFDEKYLFHFSQLPFILDSLKQNHVAIEVNGSKISSYHTAYFDTPDLACYFAHHNKRAQRFKIRTRTYNNTKDTFLEVKLKNNKKRTKKQRIKIQQSPIIQAESLDFITKYCPLDVSSLVNSAETAYNRINLINTATSERITIDFDLEFRRNGTSIELPHAVIAEVKSSKRFSKSGFHSQMRDMQISKTSISKYCTAIALLCPSVKQNNFKETIRKIHSISHETILS